MRPATAIVMVAIALIADPALAQDRRANLRAARQACKQDVQRLCQGIERGGSRIVACLRANEQRLSPQCRAVLQSRRAPE